MSIQQLQSKIEAGYSRPIRLEKTKRKRTESMRDFLVTFFTEWNNEKNTVYVDNKEEIQTDTGRRRSLGDIYMICKYYYPSLELKDLLYELYIGLREHFTTGFRTSYCSTICKRVWYYNDGLSHLVYDKNKQDEYGNLVRFYMDLLGKAEDSDMVENDEFEDEDNDDEYDDDDFCDCENCRAARGE